MRTQTKVRFDIRTTLFTILLFGFLFSPVQAQEDDYYKGGMWTGLLWRFDQAKAPDLSVEYQVRLGDNFRSLKSHFFEGLAYAQCEVCTLPYRGKL